MNLTSTDKLIRIFSLDNLWNKSHLSGAVVNCFLIILPKLLGTGEKFLMNISYATRVLYADYF